MSKKINLDKYYTNYKIVKHCLNVVDNLIIDYSEVIEPSAGNGAFSLKIPNCIAYDIAPEHESIIKQDFLKLKLPYKEGRLIIGNPPFGMGNTLSVKFFKHSVKMCDYIAFIMPISQYKNNQQMYEFDLIHSEELPLIEYSNRKLLCCFNIYRRPKNRKLNKKPINYKLKDVEVLEYRRGGSYKKPKNYDFAFCAWGSSIGKKVNYIGQFAQENYIIIKNEKYRSEITKLIENTNWINLYPYISSPKIQTWKIYKYLKDSIPGIE